MNIPLKAKYLTFGDRSPIKRKQSRGNGNGKRPPKTATTTKEYGLAMSAAAHAGRVPSKVMFVDGLSGHKVMR